MKLTVRNFGPIKNAEILVKPLLILIGTQGVGKSIIAKLISIFYQQNFENEADFFEALKTYNIDFQINKDTYFEFSDGESFVKLENGEIILKGKESFEDFLQEYGKDLINFMKNKQESEFSSNPSLRGSDKWIIELFAKLIVDDYVKNNEDWIKKSVKDIFELRKNLFYIPAERNFLPNASEYIFKIILEKQIEIPRCVVYFGAKFEEARKNLKNFDIPFLSKIRYVYENQQNKIEMKNGNQILLSQSSSGMQTSVPMALVIKYFGNKPNSLFIIEEPELNLYPISQKLLVNFLSESILQHSNRLILTTHSPYILTSFANLVEAHNVSVLCPESISEIEKIIPKEQQINFENVAAYYIDDGISKDILNYDEKTIDANAIDDVSEIIMKEFDEILKIKYREK